MQDKMKRGSESLTMGKRRRLLAYTRWEIMLRTDKEKGNRSTRKRKIWMIMMPEINRLNNRRARTVCSSTSSDR